MGVHRMGVTETRFQSKISSIHPTLVIGRRAFTALARALISNLRVNDNTQTLIRSSDASQPMRMQK